MTLTPEGEHPCRLGALGQEQEVLNDRGKRCSLIDDDEPRHWLRPPDPFDGELDHGVPVVGEDDHFLSGRPAEDNRIFGLGQANIAGREDLDGGILAEDTAQDVLIEAVIGEEADHPLCSCRSLFVLRSLSRSAPGGETASACRRRSSASWLRAAR